MQEAVQAGERVLQTLYAARDKLGSARNWGIFDMLGGGFISDFVKHSKMNDAAALMEQAKSDIQRFQRELRDVQVSLDLRMEIGSFLWSLVDKEDYLLAMERSPIRDIEIKYILKQALTDKVNDREVYMKGIDYSYYYEGYVIYKAENL